MLREFIEQNRLNEENISLRGLSKVFLDEMQKGLAGQESSLLMIPSYAYLPDNPPRDKSIAVIDAGGTNLRVALVRFDKLGNCEIDSFEQFAMPGTRGEIHKSEFFDCLAGYLSRVIDKAQAISVSFAYPTEILPNGDGRILKLVKEVKVTGIEGCVLGEELSKSIEKAGYPKRRVLVTNDTVATALSGVTQSDFHAFNHYIGVIEGTGANACYDEAGSNIGKLKLASDRRMMINIESGSFNKFELSDIDKAYLNTTKDPDYHVMEKFTSGGYLGGFAAQVINAAADSGIIKTDCRANVSLVDTKEISLFLMGGESMLNGYISSDADKKAVDALIDAVLRRTASFIALETAGGILQCASRGERVFINVEGSTYYKLPTLKERVEKRLNSFISEYGIQIEMGQIEDAVIKGSAIVAV